MTLNLKYSTHPIGLAYLVLKGDLDRCNSRYEFEQICKHWVWARIKAKQTLKTTKDKHTEFNMSRKEIFRTYLKNARYSLESHAVYWGVNLKRYNVGGLTGRVRSPVYQSYKTENDYYTTNNLSSSKE